MGKSRKTRRTLSRSGRANQKAAKEIHQLWPSRIPLQYYIVADNIDGVIELVQIGALEIHVWGSREDKLEQPDMMIFDLDPAHRLS